MTSTTKLLKEYIQEIVIESNHSFSKRLRVFDFDDTLVKTDAKVHVKNGSETFDIAPGEFAIYDKQPGDEFDYTDFEQLVNPRSIKWVVKILHNVYKHHGPTGLVVLSARGASAPILQFLQDAGFNDIEVIALGDASPHAKASWVDERIKRDSLDMVEFFDDSHKNVAAVKELQKQHPDVEIVTRHIVHNRIKSLNN